MTILAQAHTWIDQPHGMNEEQVELLMHGLLDAQVVAVDGAEVLRRWAIRGETALELATVVKFLRQRAVQIPLPGPSMDLCGTGGSNLTRYNVSTTVAFVLATAGVPIAKHGNRGSKRPNGSFDLLDALGIPFQLTPPQIVEIFAKTGICFLFARSFHPVVARVAGMRKLVAGRTIFNLAGPLANPCRPSRQVVGVTNEATAQVIAGALTLLGVERSIVVRGHPGIDEVSITGPTHLWEVADGHTHHRIVEHFHHHGLDHDALPGGDAPENARIFQSLLAGEENGPLHDMIVANAALALDCWRGHAHPGSSSTIDEVRELLASKAVAMSYVRHRRVARAVAGIDV